MLPRNSSTDDRACELEFRLPDYSSRIAAVYGDASAAGQYYRLVVETVLQELLGTKSAQQTKRTNFKTVPLGPLGTVHGFIIVTEEQVRALNHATPINVDTTVSYVFPVTFVHGRTVGRCMHTACCG